MVGGYTVVTYESKHRMNSGFLRYLPKSWRQKILHRVLKQVSSQYVEGTAEGSQILRKLYPRHLYDPLRRDMAVELGGKEIAKVLDVESTEELERIRKAFDEMYDEREDVYAPIHDFWSSIEMVLHIKKKELPELITAENVQWSVQDVPLGELEMTWMPFLTKHEAIFGKKPWKVAELQRIYSQSPELLEQAKQDQIEIIGDQQHKFDQSQEPIAVLRRTDGYSLIDGNGRLYHAILTGKETIKCYVGVMQGDAPTNYWISSGSIKQLCLEIRGYASTDPEGYVHGSNYLRTKLRLNSTALINYQLYLRDDFPEFEELLGDLLPPRPT